MKFPAHLLYWMIIGLLLTLFIGECRKKSPEPCPTAIGTTETKKEITGAVAPYTPTPTASDSGWIQSPRGTSTRTTNPEPLDMQPSNTAADYFTPDVDPGKPAPSRKKPSTNKVDPITYYHDSTELIQGSDTVGKVWVNDKIQNNLIAERTWRFQAFKVTTTNNVEIRKNRWFVGIKALGNQEQPVQWFGGSLGLLNKKQKKFFTMSAGPMNNRIFYEAGVYFKIGN